MYDKYLIDGEAFKNVEEGGQIRLGAGAGQSAVHVGFPPLPGK